MMFSFCALYVFGYVVIHWTVAHLPLATKQVFFCLKFKLHPNPCILVYFKTRHRNNSKYIHTYNLGQISKLSCQHNFQCTILKNINKDMPETSDSIIFILYTDCVYISPPLLYWESF